MTRRYDDLLALFIIKGIFMINDEIPPRYVVPERLIIYALVISVEVSLTPAVCI